VDIQIAALDEARALKHEYVRLEHFLLALTREPQSCLAGKALARCGVTAEGVTFSLQSTASSQEVISFSLTSDAQILVGRAEGFAISENISPPRAEHYLLAVIWSAQPVAALENAKVTPRELQSALAELGVAVPTLEPPSPQPIPQFGEAVEVSARELDALMARVGPLLSPPKITIAVGRDEDRTWVRAAKTIDLTEHLRAIRSTQERSDS
jgi:ATP-dependent Clp protease ATP-binding subunit ClpA